MKRKLSKKGKKQRSIDVENLSCCWYGRGQQSFTNDRFINNDYDLEREVERKEYRPFIDEEMTSLKGEKLGIESREDFFIEVSDWMWHDGDIVVVINKALYTPQELLESSYRYKGEYCGVFKTGLKSILLRYIEEKTGEKELGESKEILESYNEDLEGISVGDALPLKNYVDDVDLEEMIDDRIDYGERSDE